MGNSYPFHFHTNSAVTALLPKPWTRSVQVFFDSRLPIDPDRIKRTGTSYKNQFIVSRNILALTRGYAYLAVRACSRVLRKASLLSSDGASGECDDLLGSCGESPVDLRTPAKSTGIDDLLLVMSGTTQ